MKLKQLFSTIFDKRYTSTILLIAVDVFLIITVGYVGYKLYGYYGQITQIRSEIEVLKNQSLLIKNNKDVLQDSIEEYNALLDKLIPDEESYFQVIAALDQMEQKTGVDISSYSINLEDTTNERMSLSLTVNGSSDALYAFLQKYRYESGRLITNDSVTYTTEPGEPLNFVIHLFHNAYSGSSIESSNVVQKEDVDALEEIRQKLQ